MRGITPYRASYLITCWYMLCQYHSNNHWSSDTCSPNCRLYIRPACKMFVFQCLNAEVGIFIAMWHVCLEGFTWTGNVLLEYDPISARKCV